jgi:hypothetical protein
MCSSKRLHDPVFITFSFKTTLMAKGFPGSGGSTGYSAHVPRRNSVPDDNFIAKGFAGGTCFLVSISAGRGMRRDESVNHAGLSPVPCDRGEHSCAGRLLEREKRILAVGCYNDCNFGIRIV